MVNKRIALAWILAVAAGCSNASDVPDRSAAEQVQIADSKLVVDVKDRLQEDGVPGHLRIRVESEGGIVTLRGDVPTKKVSGAADTSARAVPGVRAVLNRLTITP